MGIRVAADLSNSQKSTLAVNCLFQFRRRPRRCQLAYRDYTPFPKLTFINFNNFSGSADWFWFLFQNNSADFSAKIVKINNSFLGLVGFMQDNVLQILVCPIVYYFLWSRRYSNVSRRKSCLYGQNICNCIFAWATPHVTVNSWLILANVDKTIWTARTGTVKV